MTTIPDHMVFDPEDLGEPPGPGAVVEADGMPG
jgi:hypothetical protein